MLENACEFIFFVLGSTIPLRGSRCKTGNINHGGKEPEPVEFERDRFEDRIRNAVLG